MTIGGPRNGPPRSGQRGPTDGAPGKPSFRLSGERRHKGAGAVFAAGGNKQADFVPTKGGPVPPPALVRTVPRPNTVTTEELKS